MDISEAQSEYRLILAGLFCSPQDAQLISDDSGLNCARINFQGTPETIWGNVIKEALNSVKLDTLIYVINKRYPNNMELIEKSEQFKKALLSTARPGNEDASDALHEFHDFMELGIYRELVNRSNGSMQVANLISRLKESYDAIINYSEILSETYGLYTNSIFKHSIKTADAIGMLLTKEQTETLTYTELYLILAASILQDVSVVITDLELSGAILSAKFQKQAQRILFNAQISERAIESTKPLTGVLRLLAADFSRRELNKRIGFALNRACPVFQILGRGDLGKWLERIILSQSKQFSALSDLVEFPTNQRVGTNSANIQFLAICLKIGSLLDVKTPRVSPELVDLPDPIKVLSPDYWDCLSDIDISSLEPRKTIKLTGQCPSQEAERLLRDWNSLLQAECERAVVELNSGPMKYGLQLGRLEYHVKPGNQADGTPLYEFHNFRFNLDEEQVFKRLFGARLYGRPDAALRELIQNSLDATRVRLAIDCSKSPKWKSLSELEKRTRFLEAVKQRHDELSIQITLENRLDSSTGRNETWLKVSDQGVGMSREVIERFLLKVGRSRWREDPTVRSLGIGTVGEFGIGFISCFMISDRTVIETQSCLPNEKGIKATVYNWRGYLATEASERANTGTEVSLLLKPDLVPSFSDLEKIVEFWSPFLELPIVIRNIDGKETRRQAVKPGRCNSGAPMQFIPIGEQGSLLIIREDSTQLLKGNPPPFCQDGLTIPDVSPPIDNSPAQEILRHHCVRLNLCGLDRMPLDLSRNLVEGGAEKLWEMHVPKIWEGIVENGLVTKAGKNAFRSLVQTAYEKSQGRTVFFIGPKKKLSILDVEQWPDVDAIQFFDKDGTEFGGAISSDLPTVILPDVPVSLLYGHNIYSDQIDQSSDPTIAYWAKLGGHFIAEDSQSPLSLRALHRYKSTVFEKYTFLSVDKLDRIILSKKKVENSISLEKLIMFRLTDKWLAIRNVMNNNWEFIHVDETNMWFYDLPDSVIKRMVFEQYVVLVLYDIWPRPSEWEEGGPLKLSSKSLGDLVIQAILESGRRRSLKTNAKKIKPVKNDVEAAWESLWNEDVSKPRNPSGITNERFYEDDSDDGEWGDDDDDYDDETIDVNSPEDRRANRHGVNDYRSYSKLSSRNLNRILPHFDHRLLEGSVAPWDRKWWGAFRDEVISRKARVK